MTLACTPPPGAPPAVAERLADYLDCHAQALGQRGFEELAGGWLGPAMLWGCLTIYVGLIGYRLLLRHGSGGQGFGPQQALVSTLRAGLVVAFASHWSAYEPVVYRVAIAGPAEVAGRLLSQSDLPPLSLPEAARRLDLVYDQLQPAPSQAPAPTPPPTAGPGLAITPPAPQQTPSPPPSKPASPGGALLALSILGSLAAVRLAAGVLLAVGPLFIILGLFDATLGVFEGWVGALVATFFATVGCTLVAALELGFLEAQLARADQTPPALDDAAQMTVALLFAASFVVILGLSGLIGRSFRLVTVAQARLGGAAAIDFSRTSAATASQPAVRAAPEPASRAQTVAQAVLRLSRREQGAGGGASRGLQAGADARAAAVRIDADARSAAFSPSNPGARRRAGLARTGSANRRDGLA